MMKEIDFLPEWYKQGRAEQKRHREFYFAMALVITVMLAWSVYANSRLAVLKSRNATLRNAQLIQSQCTQEYDRADSEYKLLKSQYKILNSVKPHITVSAVIAELTHLLADDVILKRLEIKSENISEQDKTSVANNASTDRKTKFRIAINGLASDATTVADVINRLEKSDYFFNVTPVFSKNVIVGQYQASEFEVTCYLANYKIEN